MKIVYFKSAEKEILSLHKKIAQKIHQKILLLGNDPFSQGSQKLSGAEGYRIRIGDYRVIYIISKQTKTISQESHCPGRECGLG